MINISNAVTAISAANLLREGRDVLFDPVEAFAGLAGFARLGLFPPDATIAPAADVTRNPITAKNPEGGPDITVAEGVSSVNITYDIPVLTPDDTVRALHNGAPSVALSDAGLDGVSVAPFDPAASILGRMIVIARRPGADPDRLHRVFWHPRAFLQSNGTGDSQDQDTLIFRVTVQPFVYAPGAAFAAQAAQITQYGAIFSTPASKLGALLDALAGEAAA